MRKIKDAHAGSDKHRASAQAVVTFSGGDHDLGQWNPAASRKEYNRLIGQWLAAGRQLIDDESPGISVAELAAAYPEFAKGGYRKNGEVTEAVFGIKVALPASVQSVPKGSARPTVAGFGGLQGGRV